jgi:hypothetical protein
MRRYVVTIEWRFRRLMQSSCTGGLGLALDQENSTSALFYFYSTSERRLQRDAR